MAEKFLCVTFYNLLLPYDGQRKGRSSPLEFMLEFCPAYRDKPEGILYNMRREAIKILPNGAAILGIFDEIRRHYVGNKVAALRGWLVNHRLAQASATDVAQAIGFRSQIALVRAALKHLEREGLLTRTDRPAFEDFLQKDQTIELWKRAPCPNRDQIESGKFPPADNPAPAGQAGAFNAPQACDRPQGREANAFRAPEACDRPQGREAASCDRSDEREGDPKAGTGKRTQRSKRSDAFRPPPEPVRPAPEPVRPPPDAGGCTYTRDLRPDTADLRPETGDGRPDTPPAAPASAAPPPLPLSAHRLRQTGNKKPASASAAPSPTPLDGQTKDAPTADAPARQGRTEDGPTADPPTGNPPTLSPQATQSPPDGLGETGKTADGLSPTGNAEPPTEQPPSADDAAANVADPAPVATQAQDTGQPVEPPEPTKADPGLRASGNPQPGSARLVESGHPLPPPPLPKGFDRDMTMHSERFAEQILVELYPTQEELVKQGRLKQPPQAADEFRRRELASFASSFEKALVGLDARQAMEMIGQGLKMARGTFRKKCTGTRGRLWGNDFRLYVASLRRRLTH